MKTSFSTSSLEAGTAVNSQGNAYGVSSAEEDRPVSKITVPVEVANKGSSDSVYNCHLEPPTIISSVAIKVIVK